MTAAVDCFFACIAVVVVVDFVDFTFFTAGDLADMTGSSDNAIGGIQSILGCSITRFS